MARHQTASLFQSQRSDDTNTGAVKDTGGQRAGQKRLYFETTERPFSSLSLPVEIFKQKSKTVYAPGPLGG
jgi:hypothetical protein